MSALDFTTKTITDRGGAVLRYAGDAVLAEFPSVVVAVESSVVIQNTLVEQNRTVPEDRKVRIRIGVNLGDVMEDRGEIFGDGVNLAARLEGVAEPGGLCISSAVYEQISGKLDISFKDGGHEEFKNIANPVHVYRWKPEPAAFGEGDPSSIAEDDAPVDASPGAAKRSDKPSIAVLPFTNMSGDPEQEYFTDGISEDIITDLSKVSGLFIITRNTAFTYKGKNADLTQVSRDLGVRYVLEGSVRKAGDRVRITAQLIDGTTNGHVWAERYDRDLKDIFGVQDEVTQEIVNALRVLVQRRNHGWSDTPDETLEEGFRMACKAVELDDSGAQGHIVKGFVHLWRHEHDQALAELDTGLTLDPNHADGHMWKAIVCGFAGDPQEGVRAVQHAMRLNPGSPFWYLFALGNACFAMERYEECVAACRKAIGKNPNFIFAQMLLASGLGHLGRSEGADGALGECRRLNPHFSLAWARNLIPYKEHETIDRFSAGLKMAGLGQTS